MQGTGWKPGFGLLGRAVVVDVDAQPVHVAPARDLLRADHRHVVLGLAGDDAGVAADARRGVDHHAPGGALGGPWRIKAWQRPGLVPDGAAGRQVGERDHRIEGAHLALEPHVVLRVEDLLHLPRFL